jgi:hypothetical protein
MDDCDFLNRMAAKMPVEDLQQEMMALVSTVRPDGPIDLVKEQMSDPICYYIRQVKSGASTEELVKLWSELPDLAQSHLSSYRMKDKNFGDCFLDEKDHILYYKAKSELNWDGDRKAVFWIPRALRERFFHALHGSQMGGHRGREQTLARFRNRMYCIGLEWDKISSTGCRAARSASR